MKMLVPLFFLHIIFFIKKYNYDYIRIHILLKKKNYLFLIRFELNLTNIEFTIFFLQNNIRKLFLKTRYSINFFLK